MIEDLELYEVWIICTRGEGHKWRRMNTFTSRLEADEFVQWHKDMDRKFPQGHYRYKIETIAPFQERAKSE